MSNLVYGRNGEEYKVEQQKDTLRGFVFSVVAQVLF